MSLKAGRVGVNPADVNPVDGHIIGGGSGGDSYTKAESDNKFLAKTDASSTYLSKSDASSTYLSKTDAASDYLSKSDASGTYQSKADADAWVTTTGTEGIVQSDNTVTFTGLNDVYAYELFCQNKLIGISSVTKTGSGTAVTVVYTVSGATAGDVCKLRIVK